MYDLLLCTSRRYLSIAKTSVQILQKEIPLGMSGKQLLSLMHLMFYLKCNLITFSTSGSVRATTARVRSAEIYFNISSHFINCFISFLSLFIK